MISATKTLGLITKYGADAVFVTYASETYDPATGKTTHGEATEHTHKVVEENRVNRLADGVDMILYASSSGMTFTPRPKMEVVYKGRTWVVVDASPTVYAGSVVLWTLNVKGKG